MTDIGTADGQATLARQLAATTDDAGWTAVMRLMLPQLVEKHADLVVGLIAERAAQSNTPLAAAGGLFSALGLRLTIPRKKGAS